jgi:PncC family amidohydrolase
MREEKPEVTIGKLLTAAGLTLALAESCTGGLVCSRITDVPGSSDYLKGGAVTYSNAAKQQLLGVEADTLETAGAVSEQTALQMARGARRLFGADIGVSVTGIAGPGGGTPEKPVGLVYVAISTGDGDRCERHLWKGDRRQNKASSAEAALLMVQRHLQECA